MWRSWLLFRAANYNQKVTGTLQNNFEAVGVDEAGQELKLSGPRLLFAAHGIANRLGPYDAGLDEKKFLVNGNSEPLRSAPLTLVVDWDAELKKKCAWRKQHTEADRRE